MAKTKLTTEDHTGALFAALKKLPKQQVFVGIPESSAADRTRKLEQLADGVIGNSKKAKRKKNRYKALISQVTNAGLLFIHTKGSELKHIPARPVLEPAIAASGNKENIAAELTGAAEDVLEGKDPTTNLRRAGIAAQNAARKWFTDPRNNWAPNSPDTIKRKGSDRPLIDTGAMRAAITYIVKSEG